MKTIMEDMNDKELREIANKALSEILKNDRGGYEEARTAINYLGLGGFWKGSALATVFIYRLMQNGGQLVAPSKVMGD